MRILFNPLIPQGTTNILMEKFYILITQVAKILRFHWEKLGRGITPIQCLHKIY